MNYESKKTFIKILNMSNSFVELSLLLVSFSIISFNIFNFLYEIHPTYFIDEVFHIPQGLRYCSGNFTEWDPKITTLPGLYIVSFGILRSIAWITTSPICSPYNLKLINVLCSSVNLFLLYSILTFKNGASHHNKNLKTSEKRMALWSAFNIAIFPVSYMLSFFYYTDTLSTFSFLLMYHLHIEKHFHLAGAIGIFSVLIRQTNIIWVGYLLLIMNHQLINRIKMDSTNFLKHKKLQKVMRSLFPLLLKQLQDSASYIFTCILFVVFLYVNGGIVVGDKSAHKPVFHACQLFYFSLFSLVFAFPHFLGKPKAFFYVIKNNLKTSLFVLLLGISIVHYFTMVHPYLLADNRHYSFYVWKRLYGKYEMVRYLLLPIYFFGFYCLNSSLEKRAQFPFWLCCTMCLVPQKLLEFRYFLLPFTLFRLQLKCKHWQSLALESAFFICINFLTFYIFVTKEFYWSDSKEIQRIIW